MKNTVKLEQFVALKEKDLQKIKGGEMRLSKFFRDFILQRNMEKKRCRKTVINLGLSDGKESTRNAGDLASIPGLGRSPGEGNSYTFQHSGLENAWTRLSN